MKIKDVGFTQMLLDRNGRQIKEGQKVLVYPYDGPGKKSMSRHPFHATIIRKLIPWIKKDGKPCGPQEEWCTSVEGGHDAVINDYLLSRIEVIG